MKYKNPDYLARQVRARRGASALGKLAGWNLANYSELIPPALQEYGYDPTADVFVIPWSGRALAPIMAALREVRSTAVLVMPGITTIGTPTYLLLGDRLDQRRGLPARSASPLESRRAQLLALVGL